MHVACEIDVEVRRCWEVGTWVPDDSSFKGVGPVESVVSIGSTVAVVLGDIDIASESEGSAGGITGDGNIPHLGGGVDGVVGVVVDGDDGDCSVECEVNPGSDGDPGRCILVDIKCVAVECSSGDGSDVSVVLADCEIGCSGDRDRPCFQ